jgi:phenylalanyl-tRNA synthetase beta chain
VIKGQKVLVKTLPQGTPFVTLDGVERKLHEEDIMICDAESNPLCIAGVYGGLHSGVTEDTTEMLLESAYFNPVSIRKTSKRHGLHTDASFRFERGVDANAVELALKRAAIMIVELTGGKISSSIQDFYPEKIEDHQVVLHFDSINRMIPQKIPKEIIKEILISLEIKIVSETKQSLGLNIPSYRVDVYREADVIEEILRVYGYNNVDYPEQVHFSLVSEDSYKERFRRAISSFLTSQGYFEMMSNSLTKQEYITYDPSIKEEQVVKLLNPLSADLSIMRPVMLFGVLESIAFNMNRKQHDILLFEIGKTYQREQDTFLEENHLVMAAAGAYQSASWNTERRPADFFYMKGIVSALLNKLGIENWEEYPLENTMFSEGINMKVDNKTLMLIGRVHPELNKRFGIKQEILFVDADFDALMQVAKGVGVQYKDLPKYPEVKRDLALIIDRKVSYSDLYKIAFETEKRLLRNVHLFDVYEGDKIPKGKKSYALSFILRDDKKTLKEKQIDRVMKSLTKAFEEHFGAELRT